MGSTSCQFRLTFSRRASLLPLPFSFSGDTYCLRAIPNAGGEIVAF